MRFIVYLVVAVVISACGRARGRFAFTIADHGELPVMEQRFFQPQRFVRSETKPIFERDDVVWYAYKPVTPKSGRYYGVSLQKKNLGYQEIDLRNRTIAQDQGMLIDHYRQLDEGEYRLKIAYENEVIDQIDFIVVSDSASESIDFESDEAGEV